MELEFLKNANIRMVLLAICIHIVLFLAVCDNLFRNPLEQGMNPVKSTNEPLSKRVVLLVLDGLKSQEVYNRNEDITPFINSIRKNRSSWGISYAGVPTWSRINQVSIISGFHEDPDVIIRDWKRNKFNLDTVHNQSKNSWVIASSSIFHAFNYEHNHNLQHVRSIEFPTKLVTFLKQNKTLMDKWIYSRLKLLLNESEPDLYESGNIFSLHFSGVDMAAHTYKLVSPYYIAAVKSIDKIIEKIEKMFNEKFIDNSTTFILTSDHGVTYWGTHGSDSNEEIFTPFITWGAGIKINSTRQDINQIDIASLISALLGLNYPMNSLGKLPFNYLNLNDEKKLHLLIRNLQQVYNIFEMKEEKIRKRTFYYKGIINRDEFYRNLSEMLNTSNSNYEESLLRCQELFDLILKGINYFDNYFLGTLIYFVFFGLFLWFFFIVTTSFGDTPELTNTQTSTQTIGTKVFELFFISTGLLLILLCFIESFPIKFYFYILLPNIMLYFIFKEKRKIWHNITNFLSKISQSHLLEFLFYIFFISVLIISFYYRYCLFLMMAIVSLMFYYNNDIPSDILKYLCIFFCFLLAIFPFLPIMVTVFDIYKFSLGFMSWQYLNFVIIIKKSYKLNENFNLTSIQKYIFGIQNFCFVSGSVLGLPTSLFEVLDDDYDEIVKVISWIVFLIPICLIPCSMSVKGIRMLTILMAFSPFYIMTTTGIEMLFLTIYTTALILWITIEIKNESVDDEYENFRKSLIFVAMILIGYFGPGNVVSINAFDPMWVKCFVSSLRIFEISILILLKHNVPFLYTMCVFLTLIMIKRMNLIKYFSMIIIISDIMLFYFMYDIRNVDLPATLVARFSRFLFINGFIIYVLFIYFIVYFLMTVEIDLMSILKKIFYRSSNGR